MVVLRYGKVEVQAAEKREWELKDLHGYRHFEQTKEIPTRNGEFWIGNFPAYACWWRRQVTTKQAVSYTHLDVYKRQEYYDTTMFK